MKDPVPTRVTKCQMKIASLYTRLWMNSKVPYQYDIVYERPFCDHTEIWKNKCSHRIDFNLLLALNTCCISSAKVFLGEDRHGFSRHSSNFYYIIFQGFFLPLFGKKRLNWVSKNVSSYFFASSLIHDS